jgi:hypothetical protein
MVMATLPFPQEPDVSRASETSNAPIEHRTGDGRFAKGNPGGPGRPRGAVRGAAAALDQVAPEAAAELIKVVLELARAGDREMLKMVMARIWPQRRGRPLDITAPDVREMPDMATAVTEVAHSVMQGELSPQEGKEVSALLEMQRRMIETWDHEKRIRALQKEQPAEDWAASCRPPAD